MFFLMICHHHDGPEIGALRDSLRPAHRAWVASGGDGVAIVLTGSALMNEAGIGIGNFGILQAETEAAARSFAHSDPFATGGVVREITLTRLADTFRAERIMPLSGT
ncbi:YciI family protein [Roseicyclus sp.]|uniref:YciI family protein n=1 Tax=Roseicyclus sp. TaxID=1914329 RepID=UPI003F6A6716